MRKYMPYKAASLGLFLALGFTTVHAEVGTCPVGTITKLTVNKEVQCLEGGSNNTNTTDAGNGWQRVESVSKSVYAVKNENTVNAQPSTFKADVIGKVKPIPVNGVYTCPWNCEFEITYTPKDSASHLRSPF